jgi:hypothetical protein
MEVQNIHRSADSTVYSLLCNVFSKDPLHNEDVNERKQLIISHKDTYGTVYRTGSCAMYTSAHTLHWVLVISMSIFMSKVALSKKSMGWGISFKAYQKA